LFFSRASQQGKWTKIRLFSVEVNMELELDIECHEGGIMDLDVCIKNRRSVRCYTEEPVSKKQIETVLEAGVWAPTAMFREPCRFIVIENKELIKYVSDETKIMVKQMMPPLASKFSTEADVVCYNAPVLIVICAEKGKQWANLNLIDSVLAAENMFLKAFELGLGTCSMGFVQFLNSKPDVLKKIGVPENCEMIVPLILGHPKTKQEASKRKEPNILKWIR
jgi:nitroreductase